VWFVLWQLTHANHEILLCLPPLFLVGKLAAVDLKPQKPVWVFQNDASKQNLPAIQNPDGTLNFGAIMSQNFYDDMVIAVRKLLSAGSILSSPVVVKDVIYVSSTDGYLYALK
jgi:outer membrane protein assembly factor BamB